MADIITQRPQVIYLDMDGVLVDFVDGCIDLFFGSDSLKKTLMCNWVMDHGGVYDIERVFSRWIGETITGDQFWKRIDGHSPSFWADLQTYPHTINLYNLCLNLAPTYIVSSPTRDPRSVQGKLKSIQRIFGPRFRQYFLGPHKHRMAMPGALLIDDSDFNCHEFTEAGGEAILFPQPWNAYHGYLRVSSCSDSPRVDMSEASMALIKHRLRAFLYPQEWNEKGERK